MLHNWYLRSGVLNIGYHTLNRTPNCLFSVLWCFIDVKSFSSSAVFFFYSAGDHWGHISTHWSQLFSFSLAWIRWCCSFWNVVCKWLVLSTHLYKPYSDRHVFYTSAFYPIFTLWWIDQYAAHTFDLQTGVKPSTFWFVDDLLYLPSYSRLMCFKHQWSTFVPPVCFYHTSE